MDTIITCLNCSEELIHIKKEGESLPIVETTKAFRSMQAYDDKRFIRCGVCGFSGTSFPDSLIQILDETLENQNETEDS